MGERVEVEPCPAATHVAAAAVVEVQVLSLPLVDAWSPNQLVSERPSNHLVLHRPRPWRQRSRRMQVEAVGACHASGYYATRDLSREAEAEAVAAVGCAEGSVAAAVAAVAVAAAEDWIGAQDWIGAGIGLDWIAAEDWIGAHAEASLAAA